MDKYSNPYNCLGLGFWVCWIYSFTSIGWLVGCCCMVNIFILFYFLYWSLWFESFTMGYAVRLPLPPPPYANKQNDARKTRKYQLQNKNSNKNDPQKKKRKKRNGMWFIRLPTATQIRSSIKSIKMKKALAMTDLWKTSKMENPKHRKPIYYYNYIRKRNWKCRRKLNCKTCRKLFTNEPMGPAD